MYQRLQKPFQQGHSQLLLKYSKLFQQSRSFSEWARNAQKQKLLIQQQNLVLKRQIQDLKQSSNSKDKLLTQSKKQLLQIKHQFKVLTDLLKNCMSKRKTNRIKTK